MTEFDPYRGRRHWPQVKEAGTQSLRLPPKQQGTTRYEKAPRGDYDVKDAYLRGHAGGEKHDFYHRTTRTRDPATSK